MMKYIMIILGASLLLLPNLQPVKSQTENELLPELIYVNESGRVIYFDGQEYHDIGNILLQQMPNCCELVVSPDREKVAITSYGDIWLFYLDGSSQFQVTLDGFREPSEINQPPDEHIRVTNEDRILGWMADSENLIYAHHLGTMSGTLQPDENLYRYEISSQKSFQLPITQVAGRSIRILDNRHIMQNNRVFDIMTGNQTTYIGPENCMSYRDALSFDKQWLAYGCHSASAFYEVGIISYPSLVNEYTLSYQRLNSETSNRCCYLITGEIEWIDNTLIYSDFFRSTEYICEQVNDSGQFIECFLYDDNYRSRHSLPDTLNELSTWIISSHQSEPLIIKRTLDDVEFTISSFAYSATLLTNENTGE